MNTQHEVIFNQIAYDMSEAIRGVSNHVILVGNKATNCLDFVWEAAKKVANDNQLKFLSGDDLIELKAQGLAFIRIDSHNLNIQNDKRFELLQNGGVGIVYIKDIDLLNCEQIEQVCHLLNGKWSNGEITNYAVYLSLNCDNYAKAKPIHSKLVEYCNITFIDNGFISSPDKKIKI